VQINRRAASKRCSEKSTTHYEFDVTDSIVVEHHRLLGAMIARLRTRLTRQAGNYLANPELLAREQTTTRKRLSLIIPSIQVAKCEDDNSEQQALELEKLVGQSKQIESHTDKTKTGNDH
jgi:hypothetical protein